MKYNFEEREIWVKSFQSNYENQKWHNDKVYHPTELKHYDFFEPYKNYDLKISPKDIIGIDYAYGYNCPIYGSNNIDWNYILKWLKRLDRVIDNFKDIENMTEHIRTNKDQKSVSKYGNNYFTTSGQHRLCLAKYLELNDVEVYVQEFKLNKKKFVQEKYIEKVYSKLSDYNLVDSKYEYNLKSNFISLKISNEIVYIHKSLVKEFLNRYELLLKKNYIAIPSILKSIFQPAYKNKTIRKSSELNTLDFIILKHIGEKGTS